MLHQLNHSKDYLKKFRFIRETNVKIKSLLLKRDLKNYGQYYLDKAQSVSFNYNQDEAIANFKSRLQSLKPNYTKKAKGSLRVFWIGSNRDQDYSGFIQALRNIADVTEFYNIKGTYGQWYKDKHGIVKLYDPEVTALNDRALIEQITKENAHEPYDLLLAQTWRPYISDTAISTVKKMGIPFINISLDDRLPHNWGYRKGIRMGAVGLAKVTDLVLTTCSDACLWYGVEDCPAIFWPMASSPSIFCPPQDVVKTIDVLFIGNKYGIREKIVKRLLSHGIKVDCYGSGWANGPASAELCAELSKKARIILGIGTIGYCEDVYTLKLRDFDAPMSRALYITHRNPDLTKLYEEGKEAVYYETADECAEKIKYYLSNPDKLEAIAAAGYAKAMSKYTWDSHLYETFKTAGLMF